MDIMLEATKTEDGVEYPASAYLYVPDPDKPSTWKLRYKEYVDGRLQVTRAQLGRAATALSPGGFRGNRVELPEEDRKKVERKLLALYREHGWEPPRHLEESKQDTEEDSLRDITRLTEATAADQEGKVWRVTIIRPGWSENGRYYSKQVLAEAVRLFEGAKAYADHPTSTEERERPERSIRDLVGWYEGVQQEADGRITANLHILESAGWLRSLIKEAPHLVGISINALGTTRPGTAEGRTGLLVEAIRKVRSADLVTEAAAGGTIEKLIASNRKEENEVKWEELTIDGLKENRPDLIDDLKAQIMKEAKPQVENTLNELKETINKVTAENQQLKSKLVLMEAKNIIAEKVAASNLPKPAQARVKALLESSIPTKDGALDVEALNTKIAEAIKAEQEYLVQIGAGKVTGNGEGAFNVGGTIQEALKKAEEALDSLFGIKTEKKEGDK